ncbi:MAG: NAD-dependent epimerase/dehydratase family protein [Desulfomonilaceae bacterium]|nr:NAD-dependent epimerase/dehydratase family protein [Desulfomonilaceae bacterium]
MGKSTLVTGGAGFMGSHIADELLKRGHDVVVLDDLSGGFIDNVPDSARFVEGSVVDDSLVNRLFEEHRFDYVFHLAAYAAEGLSHFIKKFNYENNLIGSVNLINSSVNFGVKCFVFTSSIAVYGAAQLPMTEETPPLPEDSYGIAKYAVELDLKSSREMFGLNYVIFRPHNVYGERQNIGDKYRNVIGIFINQLMRNEPMTVFGDGKQTRAFSYIGDVAPVIAVSVETPHAYNQVYNVGADTPYTVNHLAHVVAQAMGLECKVRRLDARNEVMHAFSSHEKAVRDFRVQAATSLEEGVRRMVEWAKTVGARTSKEFENIEIEKNLPPSWVKR